MTLYEIEYIQSSNWNFPLFSIIIIINSSCRSSRIKWDRYSGIVIYFIIKNAYSSATLCEIEYIQSSNWYFPLLLLLLVVVVVVVVAAAAVAIVVVVVVIK